MAASENTNKAAIVMAGFIFTSLDLEILATPHFQDETEHLKIHLRERRQRCIGFSSRLSCSEQAGKEAREEPHYGLWGAPAAITHWMQLPPPSPSQ